MDKKPVTVSFIASCGHKDIALIDLDFVNPVTLTQCPCNKCQHEQAMNFIRKLNEQDKKASVA